MRPTWTAVIAVGLLLIAALFVAVPTHGVAAAAPARVSANVRPEIPPNYVVSVDSVRNPVAPGYGAGVYYEVTNSTTGLPVTTLTSIQVLGTYYNIAHKLLTIPGTPATLSVAPFGTWHFTVPKNASLTGGGFDPYITVYANTSSPLMSASDSTYVAIGTLALTGVSVCGEPYNTCGTVTSGLPARLSGTAEFVGGGHEAAAANESVKIEFYSSGSSPVTVAGVPATLTTGANGFFALTFTPLNTVFTTSVLDHTNVTVTDALNSSMKATVLTYWELENPGGTIDYALWLNSEYNYGGSPVTTNWQWRATNTSIGTITVSEYWVYNESSGNLLTTASIGSTSPTGSFTFNLPAGFRGEFVVVVLFYNSTENNYLDTYGEAVPAALAVDPSVQFYTPGEEVYVSIIEEGASLNGATLNAVVEADDSAATLFSGPVSGLSFSFTIPSVAPAGEYAIYGWATNAAGVTIATGTYDIEEIAEPLFWAGVATHSAYSDGSFAPGATLTVDYKVTVVGTTPAPTAMELYVFPGVCGALCGIDTPALFVKIVTSLTGSLAFTIPSNEPNGLQNFDVVVEYNTGPEEQQQFTINVNNAPSALNYELGAGSGLTVGWLILLLIIVIVGALLFLMIRRGRAGRSGGSVPEWKEPPAGSSASAPPPPPPASGQ